MSNESQMNLFESQNKLPDFIGNNEANKKYELSKQSVAIEKRINEVIAMGIQESIALKDIVKNGSTTVHDLALYINAPHGVLRDIQRTFGIPLRFEWESNPMRKFYKGKVCERAERYKRYFLAKIEGDFKCQTTN